MNTHTHKHKMKAMIQMFSSFLWSKTDSTWIYKSPPKKRHLWTFQKWVPMFFFLARTQQFFYLFPISVRHSHLFCFCVNSRGWINSIKFFIHLYFECWFSVSKWLFTYIGAIIIETNKKQYIKIKIQIFRFLDIVIRLWKGW